MKPILLALSLSLSGCSLLPALLAGSQALGSVLDQVDKHAGAFAERHPNQAAQEDIDRAIMKARAAKALLDAGIAAGEDVAELKIAALEAYENLRFVLGHYGVLRGQVDGGVDGEGFDPGPLTVPSTATMAELLDQ